MKTTHDSMTTGLLGPETAFKVLAPAVQSVPLVFASPHSGRNYPPDFLHQTRLDPHTLRRSEDAFVDELFSGVPELGAPMISARFPRAYVDVNREALELDPDMYHDDLPSGANTRSPRVAAGIGTIARVVANGQRIYDEKLGFDDINNRIETCYHPYHDALKGLVDATMAQFGTCLVVDCHSMPSGVTEGRSSDGSGQTFSHDAVQGGADIILGDCWGSTCDADVTSTAERTALAVGYSVRRNTPYAGGFTTRQYGQPSSGCHALQIEINRSLYMDERSITRLPVFDEVRVRMMQIATALSNFGAERMAAE
jgi:N-formylglutamate amidohydrolase